MNYQVSTFAGSFPLGVRVREGIYYLPYTHPDPKGNRSHSLCKLDNSFFKLAFYTE